MALGGAGIQNPPARDGRLPPRSRRNQWAGSEAGPLGPNTSRFASETRALATDSTARQKFRRYWSFARFGIVAIRWLLLPGVRREAERRWRSEKRAGR